MNKQIDVTALKTSMTSREIAELTGKRHDHVLRDIEEMLVDLEANSKSLNSLETPNLGSGIKSSTYRIGGQNREYPQYELDRDSTYCLITGYDAVPRMRIIKRWQELEAQVAVVANEEDELDIAFRQAEQMVSQSERMTIQAKQIVAVLKHQKEMRQEIKAIGEKLKEFDSETGYRTVLAYARDKNYIIPNNIAQQIGKEASRLCRQQNLEIGRCSDERYGQVNSYPIRILEKVFK